MSRITMQDVAVMSVQYVQHSFDYYLDSMEHPDRYERKTVRLVGQALTERGLPKGFYYFCRKAMTCCWFPGRRPAARGSGMLSRRRPMSGTSAS